MTVRLQTLFLAGTEEDHLDLSSIDNGHRCNGQGGYNEVVMR
jgi:hypothetical protein